MPTPPLSFSSPNWWQESEITLSFKIYFSSISFSRHTLMLICQGMFITWTWSKANTTRNFALWENMLWSYISSNTHLMALTHVQELGVQQCLFQNTYLMHKDNEPSQHLACSQLCSNWPSCHWLWKVKLANPAKCGQVFDEVEDVLGVGALSSRGQSCNNIFPWWH